MAVVSRGEREISSSAISSTTRHPGLNPSLCGEKPAANRLKPARKQVSASCHCMKSFGAMSVVKAASLNKYLACQASHLRRTSGGGRTKQKTVFVVLQRRTLPTDGTPSPPARPSVAFPDTQVSTGIAVGKRRVYGGGKCLVQSLSVAVPHQ